MLESLIGKQRQCPMHNFCDLAMHRIGLLEGGTGCAGLLSRALPPGLVLAWAGVLLLAGIPPEKLPASRA